MRLIQLFEEEQEPLIISMTRKLMANDKPVLLLIQNEGVLRLQEIYEISTEVGRFSDNAGIISGSPYVSILFKAPGKFSWRTGNDIGKGNGDGSFGFPFTMQKNWKLQQLPSYDGRTDWVLGQIKNITEWKKIHEAS